jgi:hypothetical protein
VRHAPLFILMQSRIHAKKKEVVEKQSPRRETPRCISDKKYGASWAAGIQLFPDLPHHRLGGRRQVASKHLRASQRVLACIQGIVKRS